MTLDTLRATGACAPYMCCGDASRYPVVAAWITGYVAAWQRVRQPVNAICLAAWIGDIGDATPAGRERLMHAQRDTLDAALAANNAARD